jgi:hypothetical protein
LSLSSDFLVSKFALKFNLYRYITGHLRALTNTDLYRYLVQEHDATTLGVLIGTAAARRGGAVYKLNPVDPTLESDSFQTLTLEYQSWIQSVPFQLNLRHYSAAP